MKTVIIVQQQKEKVPTPQGDKDQPQQYDTNRIAVGAQEYRQGTWQQHQRKGNQYQLIQDEKEATEKNERAAVSRQRKQALRANEKAFQARALQREEKELTTTRIRRADEVEQKPRYAKALTEHQQTTYQKELAARDSWFRDSILEKQPQDMSLMSPKENRESVKNLGEADRIQQFAVLAKPKTHRTFSYHQ